MKQKTARSLNQTDEFGDVYTFVGIDADTKLVPAFHMGKRTWNDTQLSVNDLKKRLVNRPQISSDAL
jgi:hypothetical protein